MKTDTMHRLLTRQIQSATSADEELSLDKLFDAVSQAYQESDQDRQRTDRSITLMIEEVEQLNTELLENQERKFEAAINNMSHGLSMFDSQRRLVVCNEPYAHIYGLPEELTRPGTAFLHIVHFALKKAELPTALFFCAIQRQIAIAHQNVSFGAITWRYGNANTHTDIHLKAIGADGDLKGGIYLSCDVCSVLGS